ncbi:hypothetical protein [Rubidibacter lacunae]|nr:hypothetical protein [Rubidibacter lacunae]
MERISLALGGRSLLRTVLAIASGDRLPSSDRFAGNLPTIGW